MGVINIVKLLFKNYKFVVVTLVVMYLIFRVVSLKTTIQKQNFEIDRLQVQEESLLIKIQASEDNNIKLSEVIKSNNEIAEKTVYGLQTSLRELHITSSKAVEEAYNECETLLNNIPSTVTSNSVGVKSGTSELEKSFRSIHNSSITSWNSRLRKN